MPRLSWPSPDGSGVAAIVSETRFRGLGGSDRSLIQIHPE